MNSKRAKRIMKQARKNSRTGKTIISKEYDRLKREHKSHSVKPKTKLSKRQQRMKKSNVIIEAPMDPITKEAIRREIGKMVGADVKRLPSKHTAIKSKAHRYPRVRIATKFGYRTL